MVLNAIE